MDSESPGTRASATIGTRVSMTKDGHNPFPGTEDDRSCPEDCFYCIAPETD